MGKPLVSIITPCYNGEQFVHRFLESVIAQTYDNIELIFINDGSTDKTEEIVFSYLSKFESRNIKLIYIYQENKGQAAALNRGLKIFKGEYITWPDSDDILYENNINSKVNFLQKNQQFGMVLCKSEILRESNLERIGTLKRTPSLVRKDNLFYDLLMEKNVYFAPGGYMIRATSFLDVNPQRNIYESSAGQNWQMLLPVAYKYKCGYLNEYLYGYMLRNNSHSRQDISEESTLKKFYNHEKTLNEIIKQMKIMDERFYLETIKRKYIRKRLNIAYQYKNGSLLKEQYYELKKNNWLGIKDKIIYLRGKYPLLDFMYVPISIFDKLLNRIIRMI